MSRPVTMPVWYLVTAVCVSVLLLSIAGILYTNAVDGKRARAEREADRRWCSLLDTLDGAYTAQPPTTSTGIAVATAIHALRVNLQCQE